MNGETANDGLGIGGERRLPLRRMIGIAPASPMAGNVPCGTLLESYLLRSVEAPLQSLGTPPLDWVNAVVPLQSETGRSIACLGEPDGVQRSNPHPARPTVQHEPENPVLGAALRHAQVEASAVGIHAGPLRLIHLERRQPPNRSRHLRPVYESDHNHVADCDERL